MMTSEKTTLIGHCQVCEREIKSSLGRIAHHGYERPGSGWQTASCMGALQLAWEKGHDALDRFIIMVEQRLASTSATLAKHEAERLPVPNRDFQYWLLRGRRGEQPSMNIELDAPRYETHREDYLRELRHEVAEITSRLNYQRARRASWALKDLVAISEEIERKTMAERAARKAEVDAKRAARKAEVDAKRAARDAKENEKRERLMKKYAVACEFSVHENGATTYCWSHGDKGSARYYRDLPRTTAGEPCWRKQQFEKYGRE